MMTQVGVVGAYDVWMGQSTNQVLPVAGYDKVISIYNTIGWCLLTSALSPAPIKNINFQEEQFILICLTNAT